MRNPTSLSESCQSTALWSGALRPVPTWACHGLLHRTTFPPLGGQPGRNSNEGQPGDRVITGRGRVVKGSMLIAVSDIIDSSLFIKKKMFSVIADVGTSRAFYFFLILYVKDGVWKAKPLQKWLKTAVFLMASRWRLLLTPLDSSCLKVVL